MQLLCFYTDVRVLDLKVCQLVKGMARVGTRGLGFSSKCQLKYTDWFSH